MTAKGWRVLVVDDEPLALSELQFLVQSDHRVASVDVANDGIEAVRALGTRNYDVVFLDVSMPGLGGLEAGEILKRMQSPPELVFVTAHENHAAKAFALDAIDYALKPMSEQRVGEVLRRIERRLASRASATGSNRNDDLSVVPVESDGRVRFVLRRDVLFAEAHGDCVRLHTGGTDTGVHLVRMTLGALEERWGAAGFLRVHRAYLVSIRNVTELRKDPMGGLLARCGGKDIPVSRRQARMLRDQLLDPGLHDAAPASR